jgi:hypothetical protein
MNWANNQQQTEQPAKRKCLEFHGVDGYMPLANDLKYDNSQCDCGRFLFVVENCGCPHGGKVLKQIPNPEYNG